MRAFKNIFLVLILLLNIAINAKSVEVTILHTNDLHSHFDGVKYPVQNGKSQFGGYAHILKAMKDLRVQDEKKGRLVLAIDAGDFFAGTIFSALAPSDESEFPEISFFNLAKFDVVTLGNHEFDARNTGFLKMLKKMDKELEASLVASNLFIKKNEKKNDSPISEYIGSDKLIKSEIIKDYVVGNQKIKIAFLGILGPDGCLASKSTRGDVGFVGFDDAKSKIDIKTLVKFINQKSLDIKNKGADLIIVSMHGGSEEAAKILKDLKNVDLVIAGHTHVQEFKKVGSTWISQTGSYGESLGTLRFSFDLDKKEISMQSTNDNFLKRIEYNGEFDQAFQTKIDHWRNVSFSKMGHTEDPKETVFISKKDRISKNEMQNPFGVELMSRIYDELNKENQNIDIYFSTTGLIRSDLYKDVAYNYADIFEMVGIGFDDHLVPGVPVVSFYLTAKEVSQVIQFLELYSHVSANFSPIYSNNLTYDFNKWGVPFVNRIKDIKINGKELKSFDRLIKIATNDFVVRNLDTISTATYGMVKIDPKNEQGQSTRDFPKHLKEYQYLYQSFKLNP